MTKLINCPWCGNPPKVLDYRDLVESRLEHTQFAIVCRSGCKVAPRTAFHDRVESSVKAWNNQPAVIALEKIQSILQAGKSSADYVQIWMRIDDALDVIKEIKND